MKLERTRNAINNTIFGLLNISVLIIFPFIIRKIIVITIGIEFLGLNGLFTSILRILNLSELGVGTAIVYSMYKPIAENNHAEICALLNLFKKIYRVIGCVILTVGLLLIPFLKYLINGDVPSGYNLYYLYIIYLLNTVISYLMLAYKASLLNAHQKTSIISLVSIISNLIMYILQIIMLYSTKNYYCYVIMILVSTIGINILNAYFTNKLYPQYVCKGTVEPNVLGGIKRRVAGLMFDKIAEASRNAFDSIIVSSFFGLEMVALYNNYYYIIAAITSILSVVLNSIAAGIGNSLVTETKEKNEQDMISINFIFISIAGCAFSAFLNLYQPFMILWMGKDNLLPRAVMIAFSVYFLSQKMGSIIGRYYDAAGLWWIGRWKGIIDALINMSLNIVLGKVFGLIGVVCATIISIMLVALPINTTLVYRHVYKKSGINFLLKQYVYFAVFTGLGYMSFYLGGKIHELVDINNAIIDLIVRLFVCEVLFFVMYLFTFFWQSDFKQAYSWLKKHIHYVIIKR